MSNKTSHLRLLELLKDGRWHKIYACVRAMKSYRLSSAIYRLRALGFRFEWKLDKPRGTKWRML